MLVSSRLSQAPTVERLVDIWAARYLIDSSSLPIGSDPLIRSRLREASLEEGRIRTAEKLDKQLVEQQCRLAAIRTRDLYAHNRALTFREAAHLAEFTSRIYLKLLEIYQEPSSIVISSKGNLWETFGDPSLEAWGIPNISKLADALEPLLLELQEQHLISKNWWSLGFITTQINLSSALLLKLLMPAEQVLITPYFKFLEEQVALPWQRICAAAARHNLASPAFAIVEQMLPISTEISEAVFEQCLKSFPSYCGGKGSLTNPDIKHSCLRDFDMFQAYLWLCFLEGSLRFVEQELVAVCIIVFEALNIPWKMIIECNKFLMDEISSRLNPYQEGLVYPYTQGMIKAFPDK